MNGFRLLNTPLPPLSTAPTAPPPFPPPPTRNHCLLSVLMWQGYGTYIMNQLKAYAVRNGCLNIMTFADNAAIGYFTKQVTSPSLPSSHVSPRV